jgi:hypothetical protein
MLSADVEFDSLSSTDMERYGRVAVFFGLMRTGGGPWFLERGGIPKGCCQLAIKYLVSYRGLFFV